MSDRVKAIVGDELYAKLLEKGLKASDFDLVDGWIPKTRFNEKTKEIELLKGKITDFEKKDLDVTKLLKDHETLKTDYANLNTKYTTDLSQKDKEIVNIGKRSYAEKSLLEAGAIYPELLIDKINLDKVTVDGTSATGLKEQVENLQTNFKNMFKSTQTNSTNDPKPSNINNPTPNNDDINWDEAFKKY